MKHFLANGLDIAREFAPIMFSVTSISHYMVLFVWVCVCVCVCVCGCVRACVCACVRACVCMRHYQVCIKFRKSNAQLHGFVYVYVS